MAGKVELVNSIADRVEGLTRKQAQEAFDAVFASIADALRQGDTVKIPGFGSFSVTERSARRGRNPATGEAISIRTGKNVRFQSGKPDALQLFSTTYGGLRARRSRA